jgi:putative hydrolase of the HAD superfamily
VPIPTTRPARLRSIIVAPGAFDAVIFDIGGVLEHTPRTNWEGPWCHRLGLDRSSLHGRLRHLWTAGSIGEITLAEVHEGVSQALGLSDTDVDAFMEGLWTEYLGTPNNELIEYFASLRSRLSTGILSNSFVGARERERERYGFESMCETVVYSHEEGMKKPEPAFYQLACTRLGADPTRSVFVDDSDAILAAASDLGMTPVKFIGQQATIDHIEALLTGLTGPDSPSG